MLGERAVPDTSLRDQINKLIELQKIDREIYELRQQLKDKPEELDELKETFEAKKTKLAQLESKLKDIQVQRKEKELELKVKEEKIVKANADLSLLKTNREYTAKISEIEGIKADNSILEEKILQYFDDGDKVSAEIKVEKEIVALEEKKYQDLKRTTEHEIKAIEQKIDALISERIKILPAIDVKTVHRYERILENKKGLAIVPLAGTTCGGCYMNVTVQQINLIKMRDQFVTCELCTRILYLEEEQV